MKIRAFQRANARTDVVINALGWTWEFGLAWVRGHRTSLATLEEAERVLEVEPEVRDRDWKMRVVNRVRGFFLGY